MSTDLAGRRVLLFEDDASICRFVEIAVEELGVALTIAQSLAAGRAALADGGVELLITDLMLPDGLGTELLADVQAMARPPVRVVFSAGIGGDLRERLARLGVQRILDKPASLAALVTAVEEGLAQAGAEPAAAPPCAPAPPAAGDDAIATHFGGDAALYAAYREATLAQFGADVAEGDRCVMEGDLPALRRLGHSLKTVLDLLGDPVAAEIARGLERAAHAGDTGATARWAPLREALQRWRASAPAAG